MVIGFGETCFIIGESRPEVNRTVAGILTFGQKKSTVIRQPGTHEAAGNEEGAAA